jgi:hypothetical protein
VAPPRARRVGRTSPSGNLGSVTGTAVPRSAGAANGPSRCVLKRPQPVCTMKSSNPKATARNRAIKITNRLGISNRLLANRTDFSSQIHEFQTRHSIVMFDRCVGRSRRSRRPHQADQRRRVKEAEEQDCSEDGLKHRTNLAIPCIGRPPPPRRPGSIRRINGTNPNRKAPSWQDVVCSRSSTHPFRGESHADRGARRSVEHEQ